MFDLSSRSRWGLRWAGASVLCLYGDCLRLLSSSIPVGSIAAWSPLRCPLHSLTGISCPSCGLTRSVLSSLAGRVDEGFAFHPLGPILVHLLLSAAIWAIVAPNRVWFGIGFAQRIFEGSGSNRPAPSA
ncbi:MAG: DUF2752 domain-containing protein [Myxococcota bacterium]